MNAYIFKLKFISPVHFGDTGIDLENVQEVVNSDTFFSALVNALSANLGKSEADRIINEFLNDPPFKFTSLFPFYKDLFFLPKPLNDSFIDEDLKRSMGKELKKINWLEKKDFFHWVSKESLNESQIQKIRDYQSLVKNSYKKEIRPRVTIDRNTNSTTIYHCGYIYYCKEGGLYGLVCLKDKNYLERFKLVLNLLGQTGLGGEKTYGCGMFAIELQEVDETFREILSLESNEYTLLSLYHPSNEEFEKIDNILDCYNFIRKKGWISSGRHSLPLKRKSVGFITEGSTLKDTIKGTLVDVTPEDVSANYLTHKVYRYGYAFTVPFRGL